MRKVLILLALSLAFAVPAFAVEGGQPPQGQGPSFQQRQSDSVAFLNKRAQRIQESIACMQSATNHQQLKECWEKFRAQDREDWEQFRAAEGAERKGGGGQGGQGYQRGQRGQTP